MIKSWLSEKKIDYDVLRNEIHEEYQKEKKAEQANIEDNQKKLDVMYKTASGDAFNKSSMNLGFST